MTIQHHGRILVYRVPSLYVGKGDAVEQINLKVTTTTTVTKKQPSNKLKIRILSETSILYLICHASFILIVSLHL